MRSFIISIWWGYVSGASLFLRENNEVTLLNASSEERFDRDKNSSGYPIKTLKWLKDKYQINPEEIEAVCLANNEEIMQYTLIEKNKWKVEDYIRENNLFWKEKLINKSNPCYLEIIKDYIKTNQFPGDEFWQDLILKSNNDISEMDKLFQKKLHGIIAKDLNIEENKILDFDHHTSHAWYAYGAQKFKPKKTLVFTLDGWGAGRSGTVSIFERKNNKVEREEIYSANQTFSGVNLARIYRCMTLLLGMKPNEHEYKIMGLAAYGKSEYSKKSLKVFEDAIAVKDGDFINNIDVTDCYFWFREKLEGERFDNIAHGLQKWVENLIEEWVLFYVRKTGINDIAFSGGVAMNVKAMGNLVLNKEINNVFVPPSGGDESHIFGAVFNYIWDKNYKEKEQTGIFHSPYLGFENTKEEEINAILKLKSFSGGIIKDPKPELLAKVLSNKLSVGVCRGKAEFGARALGNRSILIDPVNLDVQQRLNKDIKSRDFWMPFAPMILDKFVNKYIVNKNKTNSLYMTISFPSKSKAEVDLKAAIHASDHTCRAQILERDNNSYLYDVIDNFEKITSRGGLLNTSFNLHGKPIVNSVEDAIYIFLNTSLSCLLLNSLLLIKDKSLINSENWLNYEEVIRS